MRAWGPGSLLRLRWLARLPGLRDLNPVAVGGACLVIALGGAYAIDQFESAEAQRPVPHGPPPADIVRTDQGPVLPPGMAVDHFLPVGTLAPDFTLPYLAGEKQVHLASFRGHRPVVLLFGSFSCNILCAQIDQVRDLHRAHEQQAQFLFVYVTEAGYPIGELETLYSDAGLPQDLSIDRVRRIKLVMKHFDLTWPCLLDTSDQQAERAFQVYHKRLLVLDRDGRVALDEGSGLGGNWDFDAVGAWLDEHVAP